MTEGSELSATERDAALQDILAKAGLRLLPFMFLLYVIAFLDRINISFAGLEMNKALNFGSEAFGLGAGIFFIGYFLFGLPSNLMVEKIGARRWITSIMVFWGILSVAMVLVKDPLTFYVLRFVLGIAEAGFFPGMILYLTYWFPARERAAAVGKFMSAIPASGILGALIAAAVLPMQHFSLAGWQWLFVITGMPAVILGASVYFYLPDRPQDAKWLSSTEKEILLSRLEEEHKDTAGGASSKGILHVLGDGKVWLLAFLYFCFTLGMYGFQLWLPQILEIFGKTDTATTALLSAIPASFQACGMILIARSSDQKNERRFHVAISAWVAAAALFAAGLLSGPVFPLAALSLSAFALWGVVGPFWALATGSLKKETAAAGIGLVNSVGNLGGFAGPYLVGLVKAHTGSLLLPLAVLAASLTLAGVIAVCLKSEQPQRRT